MARLADLLSRAVLHLAFANQSHYKPSHRSGLTMTQVFGKDAISSPMLVDAAAKQLLLESPVRRAHGRLAILHLVGEIWGEVALLRAAERFVRLHNVTLAELLDCEPVTMEAAWFAGFLVQLSRADEVVALPAKFLRPAAPGLAL